MQFWGKKWKMCYANVFGTVFIIFEVLLNFPLSTQPAIYTQHTASARWIRTCWHIDSQNFHNPIIREENSLSSRCLFSLVIFGILCRKYLHAFQVHVNCSAFDAAYACCSCINKNMVPLVMKIEWFDCSGRDNESFSALSQCFNMLSMFEQTKALSFSMERK